MVRRSGPPGFSGGLCCWSGPLDATALKALKAQDPERYRATLARIESARLGWDRVQVADTRPPEPVTFPRKTRSLESLAEAFRRAAEQDTPDARPTPRLDDYRRSLIYACTTLRADMLSGLPMRLYRWVEDDSADGRALDLSRPITRAGKPRSVRAAAPGSRRSLVEVEGAPLLSVLQAPNEDTTLRAIIRQIETGLCLAGQAHLRMHRTGGPGTKLAGLSFIKHTRLEVVKPGRDDPQRTVAAWILDNRKPDPIPAADMIWLRYSDPDDPDYGAMAPAQVAALGSEAYGQAMRSNLDIFRKGLRAGAMITPPDDMGSLGWDQADELQQDVDRQLRGSRNNHNVAVMPYRFGVERLDITPHDAEFVALLEFAIEDVARAFRIPIEMIGGTRRTYANNEAADRALWQRCLEPEAAWIAEELTRRLIPAAGLGPEYVLGFDLCDVTALQDDESLRWTRDREMAAIVTTLAGQASTGQIAPEQAQAIMVNVLEMDPVVAAAVAGSGVIVGEIEDGSPAAEAATDPTRAAIVRAIETAAMTRGTVEWDSAEHRAILERADKRQAKHVRAFGAATRRIMERQQDSILAKLAEIDKRAARRKPTMADLRELFNVARWTVETRGAVRSIYRDAAKDAGRAALDSVNAAIGWTGDSKPAVNALQRRAQRFAQSVTETTWDDLKRELGRGVEEGFGIEETGGLADIVRGVMGARIRSSGETIARTEIHGTFETTGRLAISQAADELGLTYMKEWVSALDDRVRDDHADAHGQTVGIDEEFEVGGARGMNPGETGDPGQDINCRCTSKYIVARS